MPKAAPRRGGPRPPRLDSLKNPQPRPPPQTLKASQHAQKTSMMTCPNRDCTEKNIIEDNGNYVCSSCGGLASESNIVNDLQFQEGTSGAAQIQGTHVGADQSHARTALGGRLQGGVSSREISESNGKHYMMQICNALHLNDSIRESGLAIYRLAMNYNFIQGRTIKGVAAVCLYIACRRQEVNQTMLIDFSDLLHINVFKLGQIYRDLLEKLHLDKSVFSSLGQPNPEHLCHRFAEQLDFGTATFRVAEEAIRIVQRMDRDWMTTGRRPAGICGAALILAARMNNFRRTVREVIYIVKVAELTLHKRLEEFKVTESSTLTVQQFRSINLEHACDPPAFYEQKDGRKKRRKRNGPDEDASDEPPRSPSAGPVNESDRDVTPTASQQQARLDSQAMPPPPVPIDPRLLDVAAQRLSEIDPSEGADSSDSTIKSRKKPSRKRKREEKKGKGISATPATPPASQRLDDDELQIEAEISKAMNDLSNMRNANMPVQGLEQDESTSPSQSSRSNESSESQNPQSTLDPLLTKRSSGENFSYSEAGRAPDTPPTTQIVGLSQQREATQVATAPQAEKELQHTEPAKDIERTQVAEAAQLSHFVQDPVNVQSPTPAETVDQNQSAETIQSLGSTQIVQPNEDLEPRSRAQSVETQMSSHSPPLRREIPDTEIIPEEEFADDPEIRDCLLTSAEIDIKERIWVHENADYLRAQQAKMLKKQLAQENGTERVIVRRKRKRKRIGDLEAYQNPDGSSIASSPAEAARLMMQQRGFSKKINYDIIDRLYDHSNGSSSPGSRKTGSVVQSAQSAQGSDTGSGAQTPAAEPSTPSRAAAEITGPDTAAHAGEGVEEMLEDDPDGGQELDALASEMGDLEDEGDEGDEGDDYSGDETVEYPETYQEEYQEDVGYD